MSGPLGNLVGSVLSGKDPLQALASSMLPQGSNFLALAGEAAAGAATGAAADAGLGGITDGAFGDATAQPASFGGQEDLGSDFGDGADFDLGGGDDY